MRRCIVVPAGCVSVGSCPVPRLRTGGEQGAVNFPYEGAQKEGAGRCLGNVNSQTCLRS